ALLEALHDELAPVRCAAARALGARWIADCALRRQVCFALVELLDDEAGGLFCAKRDELFIEASCPAVRTGALLSLFNLTGHDFGFDQSKWHAYLETING